MKHPLLDAILLGIAALAVLVAVLGVFTMRGAAARLHYAGAAALVAPPCVAAAVVIEQGFSAAGAKALIIAVLLVAQSPVIAHLAGRAMLSDRLSRARPHRRE